jgi:hypothetical protein
MPGFRFAGLSHAPGTFSEAVMGL